MPRVVTHANFACGSASANFACVYYISAYNSHAVAHASSRAEMLYVRKSCREKDERVDLSQNPLPDYIHVGRSLETTVSQ